MISRRTFFARAAGLGAAAFSLEGLAGCAGPPAGVAVNDVQSQLNATRVRRIVAPHSLDDVQVALRAAARDGLAVSVAGGRHAMGGQQFATGALHLDMRGLDRVVRLDRDAGLVEVEGGIEWPALMAELERLQAGATGGPRTWGIRQKQTGVDAVSLGGSLASNVHGRGLRMPPIIGDVESFVLVDAGGRAHACSRRENDELFRLAIGGYGLFGVITHVTLRLAPRRTVERVVDVIAVKDLPRALPPRLAEGCEYGDCQYSIDLTGDADDHPGVFACYRPVAGDPPVPERQRQLSQEEWTELYLLARTDKRRAFETYAEYYRSTDGQRYGSDTHQLAGSFDYYHEGLARLPEEQRGTEMITEVYVPRDRLVDLLTAARRDFVAHHVDPTYGTIRFIERDDESFLAWAREPYACIVCNLHVVHTGAGIRKAAEDFRRILDRAIEHGGNYYLTYHRFATREQVEACYPQFVDFLRLKRKYDPRERFQSDWYKHHVKMFADRI